MSMSIAVIADLHLADATNHLNPRRRGEYADVFLLRAVQRLNRFIKPDVVVVLGDLIDAPDSPSAEEQLLRLRKELERLDCPWIALPGNHDGAAERFYRVFPRPPEHVDIKGCRFLSFVDAEEPGWNATRAPADIARIEAARNGWDGVLVCLQHVPLFPEGLSDCPFNYVNASPILAAMRRAEATLSLSGHYHKGMPLLEWEGMSLLAAPALCEMPFRFCEVRIGDDGRVSSRLHQLRLPDMTGLWDCHVHTRLAYCNENMDTVKAVELAELFGLEGIVFCEHTPHVYLDRDAHRRGEYMETGIEGVSVSSRIDEYFADVARVAGERVLPGLEVDSDFHGRPFVRDLERGRAPLLVGAIHDLRGGRAGNRDIDSAKTEFMRVLELFAGTGIHVLAHPFRVFRRYGLPIPESLFEPVADLLCRHRVAAEINFHTNDPSPAFARLCVGRGVPLVFGSDAHNLYEVGEFQPHLDLLAKAEIPLQTGVCPASPPRIRQYCDNVF